MLHLGMIFDNVNGQLQEKLILFFVFCYSVGDFFYTTLKLEKN